MNIKKLNLPTIIISIGLIVAIVACMLTNTMKSPKITEQDFNYSVTYKLDGETKTIQGVYRCKFDGHGGDTYPTDRYYKGVFIVDGETSESSVHTIAKKDGLELYIVIDMNDSYLMNDKRNDYYENSLEDPFLEAIDEDGNQYDDAETFNKFSAEIISWEFPEPIDNSFVFSGISIMHSGSMLAMLLVGVLWIIVCLIFVKKEQTVTYKGLDMVSIVFNFLVVFIPIPLITFLVAFMALTEECGTFMYQTFLCIPALSAFAVAASIALRRKGFTKSGFIVQLIFPVLFFLVIIVESIIFNLTY